MTLDLIRTIFLKGIQEEYLDDVNLMGKGDISTLLFEEISDLCEKYSRSKAKIGKRTHPKPQNLLQQVSQELK